MAENHNPWSVEISSEDRDEFISILNDRRMLLSIDLGITQEDMDADLNEITNEGPTRRRARNRRSRPLHPRRPRPPDLPTMTIPYDAAKYDGYIFDCDGTIADTMPLHYQAWNETLKLKLGGSHAFSEEMFYRFGGMPAREIVERLNRDYGYTLPPKEFAHEKEMRFVELLPGIGPVKEVVAVLESLPPDAKVAVASGGLTEIVRDTLKFLGMEIGPTHKIKYLVGSDQVLRANRPPIFSCAPRNCSASIPKRCLVFEDAEPGFAAAKVAGMDYIDVRPFRSDIAAAAKY